MAHVFICKILYHWNQDGTIDSSSGPEAIDELVLSFNDPTLRSAKLHSFLYRQWSHERLTAYLNESWCRIPKLHGFVSSGPCHL
ncbi:hypothetical protein FKM82_008495 [Ascaphus truei]